MEPFIRDGDELRLSFAEEFDISDLIVFEYEGAILVHRIVRCIDQCNFVCKGDNSFRLEYINLEDIIGKVTAINKKPVYKIPLELVTVSYELGILFSKGNNIDIIRNDPKYKKYILKMKDAYMSQQG